MSKRPGGRPWARLRRHIILRDAGICALCGLPGADSVDHRTALIDGGHPTDPANLQAAHLSCNVRKENDRRHGRTSTRNTSRAW